MSRRLPPLNALRAFEAAARHLSFTKAADELNVTQGAVSHQVQGLEERLGVELFHRFNRRLALTDAGRAYLPAIGEAFDRIALATRQLGEKQDSGPLTVTVLPSFAAKWLLPRLPRFRQRHPEIEILLSANPRTVDLQRDEADVAIRFGRGEYPGLAKTELMGDAMFPVCAPTLPTPERPLDKPQDVLQHTLLHDELGNLEGGVNWEQWARLMNLTEGDWKRGPFYSDSSFVVLAAIAGQGVALARQALAIDDLAAGRLVRPFSKSVPVTIKYWVVTTTGKANWPKVQRFRDWLVEEVKNQPALPPALDEVRAASNKGA